jgi:1-deoxy-D-xylulose-5-phosphate reductoisomerase
LLCEQVVAFSPAYVVVGDQQRAAALRDRLAGYAGQVQILSGADALCDVASADEVDSVMAAIVGAAGLLPTLAAINAGKRVMLANKEALVMSGSLFMDAVKASGAELLPIDSEHNAIFQCLPFNHQGGIEPYGIARVLLTGSGGPFRTMPLAALGSVTPQQACAHPNWSMGRKISVDSATMMNKGLEWIEACWLFGLRAEQVEILLHPQSVIHSMVEYIDGSTLAQLGHPDMRTPIAYGLSWPERITSGLPLMDWAKLGTLHFETPDLARFPCLKLAQQALQTGKTASIALNAANEVAVAAFLAQDISFTAIYDVIAGVLERVEFVEPDTLAIVLEADAMARRYAHELLPR